MRSILSHWFSWSVLPSNPPHSVQKGGRVPIGMPLPGTVVKVLDEAGAGVGENGEGEVAVGGMARATYMADDPRVYDPARLRATGDLATVEAGARTVCEVVCTVASFCCGAVVNFEPGSYCSLRILWGAVCVFIHKCHDGM